MHETDPQIEQQLDEAKRVYDAWRYDGDLAADIDAALAAPPIRRWPRWVAGGLAAAAMLGLAAWLWPSGVPDARQPEVAKDQQVEQRLPAKPTEDVPRVQPEPQPEHEANVQVVQAETPNDGTPRPPVMSSSRVPWSVGGMRMHRPVRPVMATADRPLRLRGHGVGGMRLKRAPQRPGPAPSMDGGAEVVPSSFHPVDLRSLHDESGIA